MAHAIESRASSLANDLRDVLDKAERQVVNLDATNIEEFLTLLDRIEQMFESFAQNKTDVRPEEGRWESLLNRINSNPAPLATAAAKAGGMASLRARHSPAESFWWHLDTEVARRRAQSLKRAAITIGSIVIVVAVALWAVNFFFPPNEQAVLASNVSADVLNLAAEQRWDEALSVVTKTEEILSTALITQLAAADMAEQNNELEDAQQALEQVQGTLAAQFELEVWEGVLAEQVADDARAETALVRAQTTLTMTTDILRRSATVAERLGKVDQAQTLRTQADQQAATQAVTFWTQVGNLRLQIGNVAGAEQAATEALALAPNNPQVTFLAGSVAEAKGENAIAIDFFNQTFDLAETSNPQLAVIARVRMGNLLQRPDLFSSATVTQTETLTPTTP